MKRVLSTVLVLSLVLSALVAPRRAHAIFGIVTCNVPEIVIGALVLSGSLAMPIVIDSMKDEENPTRSNIWYWISLFSGLLLLDSSGGKQAMAFGPLSAQGAVKIGASAEDADYYNHELPEFKAVHESIVGETLDRLRRGEKLTTKHVHGMWLRYEEDFSPRAWSVAQKISKQVLRPQLPAPRKPAKTAS